MDKSAFQEFLIEEYKAFTDSLHKSEESGEARLTFFQTLSTAILGVVTFLLPRAFSFEELTGNINNSPGHDIKIVHIVIFLLLLSILAIGVVIQNRLKRRNLITTEFIKKIKHIRTTFKENFSEPTDKVSKYDPSLDLPDRNFTSLSDIAGIINVVITAITIVLIVYTLTSNISYSIIAGMGAIIGAIVLFFWSSLKKKDEDKENDKKNSVSSGDRKAP